MKESCFFCRYVMGMMLRATCGARLVNGAYLRCEQVWDDNGNCHYYEPDEERIERFKAFKRKG